MDSSHYLVIANLNLTKSAILKVQMGAEKAVYLESFEAFGPLLVEDLLNRVNLLVKRLDVVVASFMFLSDHICA